MGGRQGGRRPLWVLRCTTDTLAMCQKRAFNLIIGHLLFKCTSGMAEH
jgi:hypothetical protein